MARKIRPVWRARISFFYSPLPMNLLRFSQKNSVTLPLPGNRPRGIVKNQSTGAVLVLPAVARRHDTGANLFGSRLSP
jgi:hypothetical protein